MSTASPLHQPTVPAPPWHAQLWPWLLMAGPFIVLLAAGYTVWLAFAK